jgi:hypothetical protein
MTIHQVQCNVIIAISLKKIDRFNKFWVYKNSIEHSGLFEGCLAAFKVIQSFPQFSEWLRDESLTNQIVSVFV